MFATMSSGLSFCMSPWLHGGARRQRSRHALTSRCRVRIFAVMQNPTPDGATGDSVTLTRVHTFLAALLSFLGFGVLPTATIADMLEELTGWLEMAKSIRRDPQGATARIWWDAFKDAWNVHPTSAAALCADDAIAEFGKRFLPINTEEDRDTLNTADFDAMRDELDKQTQIAAELRSERDALLKTNAHHASEIESLHAKIKQYSDELDWRAKHFDGVFTALYKAAGCDFGAQIVDVVQLIRDERDELRTKFACAIIPLPKPERVEPGQRWAHITTIRAIVPPNDEHIEFVETDYSPWVGAPIRNDNWYYLGTESK
jgi:hypothetical protein